MAQYTKEVGYLTEAAEEDEIAWFSGRVQSIEDLDKNSKAAIVSVIPTNTCNFACSYCFQANTGMRNLQDRHFEEEQAPAVISMIDSLLQHRGVNHLELFGGEPLLPKTLPFVRRIVLAGEERGLPTRVTTNGFHLGMFRELLGKTRIHDLQISLDGSPEEHDKRRIPLSGAPTFDRILENILLAIAQGASVFIRPNIDARNISSIPKLVAVLRERGLLDSEQVKFQCVSVVPDPLTPDHGQGHTIPQSQVDDAVAEALGTTPAPNALSRLLSQWMARPLTYACGAPNRNVYLSPEGAVYNCHELVGRPEAAIGNFSRSGALKLLPVAASWSGRRIDHLENCRRCPLAYAHGGGCAARMSVASLGRFGNCGDFPEEFESQVRNAYGESTRATG